MLSIEEKIAILNRFPLFDSLTHQQLESIAKNAEALVFSPHTAIISQDKPGKGVYAIYKGLISIFMLSQDGKVIPIKIKSDPYLIGIMDVVDNERASMIETLQETHTIFIPKEHFLKLIKENPHLTFAVLQLITKKLREANIQTEYYFSSTLKDRTLYVLKELAPHYPERTITLSQEEIATIVGATRARVTEVLNELRDQKIISFSQRKVVVL